jgi:hypothetical protein
VSPLAALAFLLAHAALGVLLNQYSILAPLHAALTLAVGVRLASSEEPGWAAAVLGYIAGSEVLWRMTTDRLPWELGKYAVILVCIVAVIRAGGLQALVGPLLFFSLLLPSVALTMLDFNAEEARQQISFNLSGPLALVICAGFFRQVRLSSVHVQRMMLALIGPVVSIAAIAVFGILTAPEITFNTESNFATSGGFGPNQVSAMLGLGALCAFFCLVIAREGWALRIVMFATLCWLATQSALTFSRGGLFAGGGAAAVSLVFLAREPRLRLRIAIIALLVFVIGRQAVWPRLDEFTGGTITARFTEADVTRRDDLGEEDLQAWADNPVFGVGPGRSSLIHDDAIIAHTEFTRLLAEHGSLGALAIVLLLFTGFQNVRRAPSEIARAVAAGAVTWACLFMLNSAMRTVAPSLMFGLSCLGTAVPSAVPFVRARAGALLPSWRTP